MPKTITVSTMMYSDAMTAIRTNPHDLKYFDFFKDDKDIVLDAVSQSEGGCALMYSSSRLRSDKDVVLAAVRSDGAALQFASSILQEDRDIVEAAVSNSYHALNSVASSFKNDKNFALLFFSFPGRGFYLNWFSDTLQADEEVVIAAVSSSGTILSELAEFKNNRNVVLAAVNSHSYSLLFASNDLKSDYEVVYDACSNHGSALNYAAESFKEDYNIVLLAVKSYGSALEYASVALRGNREIVLAAVKQDGLALKFASTALQADREVLSEAVKQDGMAIKYASINLEENIDIVVSAARQNIESLCYRGYLNLNENSLRHSITKINKVIFNSESIKAIRSLMVESTLVKIFTGYNPYLLLREVMNVMKFYSFNFAFLKIDVPSAIIPNILSFLCYSCDDGAINSAMYTIVKSREESRLDLCQSHNSGGSALAADGADNHNLSKYKKLKI